MNKDPFDGFIVAENPKPPGSSDSPLPSFALPLDPPAPPLPPFKPGDATRPPPVPKPEAPIEPLRPEELVRIRRFLSLFGPDWIDKVASSPELTAPATDVPTQTANVTHALFLAPHLRTLDCEPEERRFAEDFANALEQVNDDHLALRVHGALLSLFPLKKQLRFFAGEEAAALLKALGGRFLTHLAGARWSGRADLLRLAAGYLTTLSGHFRFFTHEGNDFNPGHYERVPGSNPAGRTILETRGFLVVRAGGEQVMYSGQALT